ncbi:hypothetical protein Q3G72_033810 [Acer saccharum]|nr:hypothetical protein Q3G72_033810 [Acer saccharum]
MRDEAAEIKSGSVQSTMELERGHGLICRSENDLAVPTASPMDTKREEKMLHGLSVKKSVELELYQKSSF